MSKSVSRKVWSSESGDLRAAKPRPAAPSPAASGRPVVALHRDSHGRRGNGVTVLRGLALPEAQLTELARTLKQALGVGGTVKDGAIEIQSQDRERIAAALAKLGYKTKLAGG